MKYCFGFNKHHTMLFSSFLIILFFFWLTFRVLASATVVPATGGNAISSDTVGGDYTELIGPTLTENVAGDIGIGTIILNAPIGFEFETKQNSVAVDVTENKHGCSNSEQLKLDDKSKQKVTPDLFTITINVTQISSEGCNATITWSGISVRPINETPLAFGNITKSGTSVISDVTDATNFGTLIEVSGVPPTPQTNLASGGTPDLSVIIFTGQVFPNASINIIDINTKNNNQNTQEVKVDDLGVFKTSFVGVPEALHSFAVIVKDKNGKLALAKLFTIDVNNNLKKTINIEVPPTIEVNQTDIRRGDAITISGYAAPNHIVRIEIDDKLQPEIMSNKDGFYTTKISTANLDFGKHEAHANQLTALSPSGVALTTDFSAFGNIFLPMDVYK